MQLLHSITWGAGGYDVFSTTTSATSLFGSLCLRLTLDSKWIEVTMNTLFGPEQVGFPQGSHLFWGQSGIIKDSDGNIRSTNKVLTRFHKHNYNPVDGTLYTIMNYGSIQTRDEDNNVIFAINNIHNIPCDVGVGPRESGFADWTFAANSLEYATVRLDVYGGIYTPNINMRGVLDSQPLTWSLERQEWGAPLIKEGPHPEFVLAVSGQSNSQGHDSHADPNDPRDWKDSRIIQEDGETVDLFAGNMGTHFANTNIFCFQAAKQLVAAYPDATVQLLNNGIGGQRIARWAIFEEGEEWYELNKERAALWGGSQGDIFLDHKAMIAQVNKPLTAIFWHQGENDWYTDADYFEACLKRVIEQYRALPQCTSTTPFIAGTTAGMADTDVEWWTQNKQLLKLNVDSDPFTRVLDFRDFSGSDTNADEDEQGHPIHFSTRATRRMGLEYVKALQDMVAIGPAE